MYGKEVRIVTAVLGRIKYFELMFINAILYLYFIVCACVCVCVCTCVRASVSGSLTSARVSAEEQL